MWWYNNARAIVIKKYRDEERSRRLRLLNELPPRRELSINFPQIIHYVQEIVLEEDLPLRVLVLNSGVKPKRQVARSLEEMEEMAQKTYGEILAVHIHERARLEQFICYHWAHALEQAIRRYWQLVHNLINTPLWPEYLVMAASPSRKRKIHCLLKVKQKLDELNQHLKEADFYQVVIKAKLVGLDVEYLAEKVPPGDDMVHRYRECQDSYSKFYYHYQLLKRLGYVS